MQTNILICTKHTIRCSVKILGPKNLLQNVTWVKWHFEWQSDLQLGYQKITLNHLVGASPKVSKSWLEALQKSKSWKKFLPTLTLSERCRLSTRTCVNLLRFLGLSESEILCWVIFGGRFWWDWSKVVWAVKNFFGVAQKKTFFFQNLMEKQHQKNPSHVHSGMGKAREIQ